MIGESLLLRATATDGHILRDRVLSGLGVRLTAHKRTFLITSSACWPSVPHDAGSLALDERRWRQGEGDGDDNQYPQRNDQVALFFNRGGVARRGWRGVNA
jgi:hypothetical protein